VLQCYTPVASYYRLVKTIEDDPEFETGKARKRLRRFVEGHEHAIQEKAEIMIDHFHDSGDRPEEGRRQGAGDGGHRQHRGGPCNTRVAFDAYPRPSEKSPYKAIVAFSRRTRVRRREERQRGEDERLPPAPKFRSSSATTRTASLIVAEKFPDGLRRAAAAHDVRGQGPVPTSRPCKPCRGLKPRPSTEARCVHPRLRETIPTALRLRFADYYRTTVLSKEVDPNKLHDPQGPTWTAIRCIRKAEVKRLVELYLGDAGPRPGWTRSSTPGVARYSTDLDEDGSGRVQGQGQDVRPHLQLSGDGVDVLAPGVGIPLDLPQLSDPETSPRRRRKTCRKGVLETVDMDSYRLEVKGATGDRPWADRDGTIDPSPLGGVGGKAEAEVDQLSNILRSFNDQFGNIEWKDADKIRPGHHGGRSPARSARIRRYQKRQAALRQAETRGSSTNNALRRIMTEILVDHTEPVQAVQRQRQLPQMAWRHGVQSHLRRG